MKAYLIQADTEDGSCIRVAGTGADARAFRQSMVDNLSVKKKDVKIANINVGTSKGDLIELINALLEGFDEWPADEHPEVLMNLVEEGED